VKSFLEDFFQDPLATKVDKKSKNTILHDQWDREDYLSILSEMKEFSKAEDRLTDAVKTGSSAMADTFFGLLKANPELKDAKHVRPSYMLNHKVMSEAINLKEFEELRLYSVNDEIATGLSCVSMEPELEVLFDKLKHQQENAEKIEKMMLDYQQLAEEAFDAESSLDELSSNEDSTDYQEQIARIQEQMEELRKKIESSSEEFESETSDEVQVAVSGMMKNALSEAKESSEALDAWGLEPGQIQKLPAETRMRLAEKMKTKKFKRMAELIGYMQRFAMTEQSRKIVHARDEVYDLEFGDDISNILPTELLFLDEEDLEYDFWRKFTERNLLQYKLRGTEKQAKGSIIFNEDGSGSMTGDREIWAKAVGLALLAIAKKQNRSFHGIHFGGVGQIKMFDFSDIKQTSIEDVIKFAETHFGGGTDFVTPLSKSLDLLREEYDKTGKVSADIVFCTDGQAGVPANWLEAFKKEQERLNFKVYGIVIGGSHKSEPLNTICDGRVWSIKDLASGDDVKDIFNII
jgi:uncharacterized protein with von Willebrand factor type A (vWA) domain